MDSSNQNRITVILFHTGWNNEDTQKLIRNIPKEVLSVITKFELNDDIEEWINCNSKNVEVNSYPCFLITINGNTTVYSDKEEDYKKVIQIISDIL